MYGVPSTFVGYWNGAAVGRQRLRSTWRSLAQRLDVRQPLLVIERSREIFDRFEGKGKGKGIRIPVPGWAQDSAEVAAQMTTVGGEARS